MVETTHESFWKMKLRDSFLFFQISRINAPPTRDNLLLISISAEWSNLLLISAGAEWSNLLLNAGP